MRIVKATREEKLEYLKPSEFRTSNVYPLYGWAYDVQGRRLAIEYLGEGRNQPNYEVLAPGGMIFQPEGTHSLLADTLADLADRINSNVLENEEE